MTTDHPWLDGSPRQLLIGGAWRPATSGATLDSIDPSTGGVIAEIANGGAEDVDAAVAAARRAFDAGWKRTPPLERQALLTRLGDLVEQHYDELATLDSLDMGMPLATLGMRKPRTVSLLRYYAGLANVIQGETIENSLPGQVFSYALREPVGVVGAITAWNGPLGAALWKLGAILATGCTVVLKPAPESSLSALRLGELIGAAGFPDGVVNIVTGDAGAGRALSAHPGVDKIAVTGSIATGRRIIEASAGNLKRLSLELGGKSANIVFPDADFDKAVPGAAMAIFANSGQICAAGSRLFLHRDIKQAFLERLVAFVEGLRVGAATDAATQLGPIANARQLDTVMHYMMRGHEEGGRVLTGGGRLTGSAFANGYFVAPTVFAGLDDERTIVREEIFGPILSVLEFSEEAEVLGRANATPFGLAAGVWTRDLGRAHRMIAGLDAGTVFVNGYGILDLAVPFGGVKMSGYGRESGLAHLDEFLSTKSVLIDIA